ncbi:BCCT family transporter [Siminovitchia sediminis]|uniref:BCCT family transporter n=1 Tax=Siminovitchia sediminis TaxID=1274353 RepID=A0ABW4KNY6_9BACI
MLKKNSVMIISLMVTLIFILIGVFSPKKLSEISSSFLVFATDSFGWFYLISFTLFVVMCIYLAFSKYGKIRLGKDSDRPEFSTGSWLAMLFSTGLAAGLFFWGVAEPVMHYLSPPVGEGGTSESAKLALSTSFFHWGLHFWAVNCIIGLMITYFQFRKNYPPLISYTLYPLLGEKIHGPIGKIVNILTIFAILSGVTTSMGLGVRQVASGLDFVWGIDNTSFSQSILFVIITIGFVMSACYGLDRGIKRLSNINVVIGFIILALIFILGPTQKILQILVASGGDYLQNLVGMSLRMEPFSTDNTWLSNWTIFYWGWIISFATFVGIFIARISKGRTIKEFVMGTMFVPAFTSITWFSVFGGSALHFIHNLGRSELANNVMEDVTTAFFLFLQYFPFSSMLMALSIISILIFMVTSADSTVFVLGMMSEESNNPTNRTKILWGIVIAAIAITLIYSGGLTPLQSVSVAAGLPFTVVVLVMIVSFMKSLKQETAFLSEKKEEDNEEDNIAV